MSEYKRGYSKGYNAGCRRSDPELEQARESERSATERAHRVEAGNAMGPCSACSHWTRGCDDCKWGECRRNRECEGSLHGLDWFHSQKTITTSENFGCVLFDARERT